MPYHTLFDITAAGYKDWPYAIIAAVVVVCSVVAMCFYPVPKSWADLPLFWIGLILAMVLLIGLPYGDYRELLKAYRNKTYRVAEGKVANYWHQKWYNRRKKQTIEKESFTVGGIKFAYDVKDLDTFTNRKAPRISFQNGMCLRVSYLPYQQFGSEERVNRIIKLEEQLPMTNDQLRMPYDP